MSVRLPKRIDETLTSYAASVGMGKSSVMVQAVDEWLRTQDHPLIHFVQTNTGERRAALVEGPDRKSTRLNSSHCT
jgi:glucose-6-phosphate isomerase